MDSVDLEGIFLRSLELFSEEESELAPGNELVSKFKTYEDSLVLTKDRGLVVKLSDGSEFKVTIVQTKNAD